MGLVDKYERSAHVDRSRYGTEISTTFFFLYAGPLRLSKISLGEEGPYFIFVSSPGGRPVGETERKEPRLPVVPLVGLRRIVTMPRQSTIQIPWTGPPRRGFDHLDIVSPAQAINIGGASATARATNDKPPYTVRPRRRIRVVPNINAFLSLPPWSAPEPGVSSSGVPPPDPGEGAAQPVCTATSRLRGPFGVLERIRRRTETRNRCQYFLFRF